MGNKYYIKFGISNRKNAGSKAMRDVMHLLDKQGYHAMPALPVTFNKLFKLIVDIPLLILTILFFVRTRGVVVYIIPSNTLRIKFLVLLRSLLGFKLICFLNDVDQLRMHTSSKYAKEERASIAAADCILAPNFQAAKMLRKLFHVNKPIEAVEVWDYLSEYTPSINEIKYDSYDTIAYAGNLSKSPFIYKLDHIPYNFRIWGDGVEKDLPTNVHHQGAVMPDELPPLLNNCDWGLIWDGPFIEECGGPMGIYMKFYNAHKCGLYLAAGLPLIVWKQSGMAHFVESHQVGICVESLRDLPSIMDSLTKEQYLAFRKNVLHESALIRNGHYFLNALKRAERKNLTLLWRKLQPMEAGKDVLLVPKYLGEALGYNIHIVCGYDEETIQKMPAECLERMTFIKQPLSFEPKQRIPVYMRYLLTHARKIDLLMCFHRKPETFINLLLYKCLNWRGKTYVKLDTEAGKEWDISTKKGITRMMHHLMNRLFLSCCHTLSCETEQGYQFLTQHSVYAKHFSKKLVLLPNAFDEEALQGLNIKERSFEEKENLIITVGRIGTSQKNTEMLLDAVKQIEWNDWKLCLIGTIEPDFQPTITRFFAEYPQLKERVIFIGPVYDKRKLWEWYNRSKVFVLTSTWESFGIVLTEAQRFRNYLISTEVGGASSLIQQGKYGTLIPQNNSKVLADKLQNIIIGEIDINVYECQSPTLSYSDAIKPLLNF